MCKILTTLIVVTVGTIVGNFICHKIDEHYKSYECDCDVIDDTDCEDGAADIDS